MIHARAHCDVPWPLCGKDPRVGEPEPVTLPGEEVEVTCDKCREMLVILVANRLTPKRIEFHRDAFTMAAITLDAPDDV